MDASVIEFNDELIATKAFECSKCHSTLQPPVSFIPEFGNVCATCLAEFPPTTSSWENAAISSLLGKVYFPCSFHHNGCPEKFKYYDLYPHMTMCRFRTTYCFFYPQCQWNGQLENYLSHLRSSHEDELLSNLSPKNSDTFSIKCNKLEDMHGIAIISTDDANFIFRMLLELSSNKIWYKLYDLEDKAERYKISVKHVGQSTSYLSTTCAIVKDIDSVKFEKSDSTVVEISVLENIIKSDVSEIIIKIKSKVDKDGLTEGMVQHFECPVCKIFMKPPIYQCISGHSICSSCKPRVSRCPTCRGSFGDTRNYSLESLTNKLIYPCVYHELGCTRVATSEVIANHELSCYHKPYSCFFQGCYFKGNYTYYTTNHLMNMHADKMILGCYHHFLMPFSGDKYHDKQKFAMLFDNAIFKITYKQSLDNTYWAVEEDYSGSCGESLSNYTYEVCLVDARRTDKRIIRTDVCLRGVAEADMYRRCISLPNNIVMSFSNNNIINFHIKVVKKAQKI